MWFDVSEFGVRKVGGVWHHGPKRKPSSPAFRIYQTVSLRTPVNSHQTRGMSRYLTLRSYSSYPASPFSSIRSSRGILQTSKLSSTAQSRRPHQEPSSSALPGKNKNMLAYMGCLTYRYGPVLTTLCPFSSCSFTTRARYAFSRKVKNMM